MNEPLPSKYTCSQCFTVAIIPADSAEHKAYCPNCSPTVPVKYTRGISLKPGAVAQAIVTPGVFPTSIPLQPPASVSASDAQTIDKLTQTLAERDQQITALQARINELLVPAPKATVQQLVPNDQPPVAATLIAPVLTDAELTKQLLAAGAPSK